MATINDSRFPVNQQEEWRDIEGRVGYQVSNMGRVRSKWKGFRPRRLGTDWKILKRKTSDKWYSQINFCGEVVAIHIIVLQTFIGPRPIIDGVKVEARHINDIKSDNRLSNLCWGTQQENIKDMQRNGIIRSDGKLTPTKVRRMKAMYKTGAYLYRDLAKVFGVATYTVGQVIRGETWSYVR